MDRAESKINLMYILYAMNNGGAETLAIRLAEKLDRNFFNPSICSLSDQGPLRKLVEEKNIPFFSLGKKEGKDFQVGLRLRKLFKQQHVHIVHTHNQGPLLYTFLAGVLGKSWKIVHTEHISMAEEFSYSKKHLLYNNLLYRSLSGFVSIAQHLTDNFRKNYDLSRAQLTTIHNSVDLIEKHFLSSRLSLRQELGINDNIRLIGNVSALREQKNHETLIRAMGIVAKRIPDVVLVIVGDGERRDFLEKLISAENLAEHVKLIGYRSDINNLLLQFDIFALSSLYEGLPLCILEAMAAGCPVVATDVCGTNELVREGQNGFLVQTKSPEKFAMALINILKDPLRGKMMGAQAQNLIKESYNLNTMIRKYETYYKKIATT